MISKAQWKYVRISPRKLRFVADAIRGMEAEQAMAMLPHINKKGAPILIKVLKSAIANALTNEKASVKQDELYISRLLVDEAPRFKRWRPISRGRAAPYVHRFSHVLMELDSVEKKS